MEEAKDSFYKRLVYISSSMLVPTSYEVVAEIVNSTIKFCNLDIIINSPNLSLNQKVYL